MDDDTRKLQVVCVTDSVSSEPRGLKEDVKGGGRGGGRRGGDGYAGRIGALAPEGSLDRKSVV